MGKLLIGHYGHRPEAESIEISLKDCYRRLGLKSSDFVSADEPYFFAKKRGAMGKYMVFQVEAEEIGDAPAWRAGYYLLPVDAADVVKVFSKKEIERLAENVRPTEL